MNLVAARLHTLLAAPSGPFRPGPVTLDGHPVRLLAQPSMLPGNPLRWRFECPGCGRNCTLLRRPKDGDPRPRAYIHSPWRCRLCLHEPRRWRLAKAATVAKAEEALAALRQTPPERQRYEHRTAYRNRMEAERVAMAALTAAASALAVSFRRGKVHDV